MPFFAGCPRSRAKAAQQAERIQIQLMNYAVTQVKPCLDGIHKRACNQANPAGQQQARGHIGRVAQLRQQRTLEEHLKLRAPAAHTAKDNC